MNHTKIDEARQRIREELPVTPLVPYYATAHSGIWLKLENLHRTGSFKERGALNKLLQLKARRPGIPIVAASAGNHAQAVALHGTRLGFDVTIFMPEATALNKVVATRRWGAKVELTGESFDAAMKAAQARVSKDGNSELIHAFDDEEIVAGQGTVGLELLEQLPDVATVLVPIGGGGLASGTAMALKAKRPACRVLGIQTETYPAVAHAWKGETYSLPAQHPATLAEGIAIKGMGSVTLPLLKKYLDDVLTVTEEEIASAILNLLESHKVLAEGAGAVAVAALASGKVSKPAGPVVAVVSGGNIDVNVINRIIEKGLVRSGRLVRLNVIIPDRPGGLKALASLLADLKTNILQIQHERASEQFGLYDTSTLLTLETRGMEHAEEILKTLQQHAYHVEVIH